MKLKVLFMGSPDISVPFLEFVYNKNCEIAVFTQGDKIRSRGKKPLPTPVSLKAEELGIPVYKTSIKSKESFSIIEQFKPDIFLVVAYGQIIPEKVLDVPRFYPLNVHFSLLPEYRGATPVNTAILNGNKVTGTTIMVMDEGLDTGEILLSKQCSINEDDNASSLFKKLIDLSITLLDKNWGDICKGSIKSEPQQGKHSKTSLIKKDDLVIDFNCDSETVNNRIRAFNFEPGIKTFFRGKLLFIEQSKNSPSEKGEPGKIISVEKDSFTVGCHKGAIRITAVKPEGKKSMLSEAFINGYRPVPGETIG